jgi:hypothetical protein
VTVDGQTVFAPNAIPDSDDDQYLHEAGSGSTVANEIGSVDMSLFNGDSWTSVGLSGLDQATVYDGSSDYAQSDSAISVNTTDTAHWAVVKRDGDGDGPSRLFTTANESSIPSDGWELFVRDDDGSVELAHRSGGGFNQPITEGSVLDTTQFYFIGFSLSGDSADLYVWDESQTQQVNTSGSGSRGVTGDESLTAMAGDGQYLSGNLAAHGHRSSTASESEFEEIMASIFG